MVFDLELKKSNSAQDKSSLRSPRDGRSNRTQTGAYVGNSQKAVTSRKDTGMKAAELGQQMTQITFDSLSIDPTRVLKRENFGFGRIFFGERKSKPIKIRELALPQMSHLLQTELSNEILFWKKLVIPEMEQYEKLCFFNGSLLTVFPFRLPSQKSPDKILSDFIVLSCCTFNLKIFIIPEYVIICLLCFVILKY